MVICPHCRAQTSILGGFDSIDAGRFTCEHCLTEFLVIDNVPMSEEQYRRGLVLSYRPRALARYCLRGLRLAEQDRERKMTDGPSTPASTRGKFQAYSSVRS